MTSAYVHGYHPRENLRLQDQASTLVELLHSDTAYAEGSSVLEAGCGVGAQTVTLASNSPKALITSIDVSEASIAEAEKAVRTAGIKNVTLRQADIFHLPFPPESFDHVFLCFVLEHLAQPVEALRALKYVLKPGGTITVIEGDHGSTYFHPDSDYARRAVRCQVELQARAGGNALIGRALYPLLREAGFAEVHVSPRMVYVDSSKPALVEGFTKHTFTAMIEGIRKPSLESGIMSEADFDKGIADLYRTAEADGVFCYTFFKAGAVNNSPAEQRAPTGRAASGAPLRQGVRHQETQVGDSLESLKAELERFGAANDAATNERARRMLNITRDTGEFLSVLVRATLARRVLEIGTSNGYSALWLAEAARAIGGSVTTIESADYKAGLASTNFSSSGLSPFITLVHDDAGRVLQQSDASTYDLIFLDSERPEYPGWWPHLRRVLRPGGLLIVDNATSHAAQMAPFVALVKADPAFTSCLVPIGNGEFLAVKSPA